MMIKGQSVTLYEKTVTGKDDFNHDIYTETSSVIDNVVIGQPSSDDVIAEMSLSGKRIAYQLAIPKQDAHTWENNVVEFYGRKWRVVGIPTQYKDDNASFDVMGSNWPWNKQVKVECYE